MLFLVAAASVSAWLVTAVDIPQQLGEVLQPFMDSPTMLLIVIIVLVLIIGPIAGGKSALAAALTDQLRQDGRQVALVGHFRSRPSMHVPESTIE